MQRGVHYAQTVESLLCAELNYLERTLYDAVIKMHKYQIITKLS